MKSEEIKVVHIMKDGTIRKSVAGMVIPAGSGFYKILREYKKSWVDLRHTVDLLGQSPDGTKIAADVLIAQDKSPETLVKSRNIRISFDIYGIDTAGQRYG